MIGGVKVVDAMVVTKGLSMFVSMRLAKVMRGLRLGLRHEHGKSRRKILDLVFVLDIIL